MIFWFIHVDGNLGFRIKPNGVDASGQNHRWNILRVIRFLSFGGISPPTFSPHTNIAVRIQTGQSEALAADHAKPVGVVVEIVNRQRKGNKKTSLPIQKAIRPQVRYAENSAQCLNKSIIRTNKNCPGSCKIKYFTMIPIEGLSRLLFIFAFTASHKCRWSGRGNFVISSVSFTAG